MNHKDQSGFIAMLVEVVVAVLVIGVLGFIGWRLFSQSSKTTASVKANNTSSTQPSKESTTASPAAPQSTYLDIEELGIKVLLNDQVSDAVYTLRPSYGNSYISVGISAQSLIAKSSDCGNDILGIIVETTTAPVSIGGPIPVDNKGAFKFGNNYYTYHRPQNQPCLYDNQADINLVQGKINAFEQAFASTQPYDPYDGWLTYTSQVGNFTINYPSTWKIDTTIGDPVYGKGSVIRLTNNSSNGNFGMDIDATNQSETINQGAIFNWGTTTTAANGIPIWQENANANYTSGTGSGGCPRLAIGTDNTLSVQLKNGKYLSVYGSYCWAQDISTSASYQDQTTSQSWHDAINIISSIKFN